MKGRLPFAITLIWTLWSCISEPKVKIDLTNREILPIYNSLSINYNKIGVASMLSPKEGFPAYEEIIKYVGSKMGKEIDIVFTENYTTMSELVKKKQVMAAFVCSGPYVKNHDEWGMELIVAPSLYGNAYYYSYIIANKNSKINNLMDLKDKKFAFTDPESNTGKLAPSYELMKMHKKPEKFFSKIIYTGSHDKSIEAVANNLVDGASVDHLIWEYINRKNSNITSRTKIIAKLGPYASPPLVAHPECNPEIKREIREILLNMHNSPSGKKILNKLLIDKFVIVHDSSYKSIRDMQKWIDKQLE